jgi:hypothetical protein
MKLPNGVKPAHAAAGRLIPAEGSFIMKIPVTNNLKVAYVEIIDSEYNETATIGNKDVYAYDKNNNLLCVSKLKNYFSPRQLHKIGGQIK